MSRALDGAAATVRSWPARAVGQRKNISKIQMLNKDIQAPAAVGRLSAGSGEHI
jgi:hypothetical protein